MFSGSLHNSTPSRRGIRRQDGVTLLEFLVGLVLFSLLVAVLSATGKSVFKSWERGGNVVLRQMDFWSGVRLVQRQIVSTVAFHPGSGRMQEIAFWGQPRRITLVTSLALDSRGLAGLWLVRYELEPDQKAQAKRLTVRQWPAFGQHWWQEGEVPAESTILITNLEKAEFSFGSYDHATQKWQYYTTWPFAKDGRLPHVIRLSAQVKGKNISLEFPLACAES